MSNNSADLDITNELPVTAKALKPTNEDRRGFMAVFGLFGAAVLASCSDEDHEKVEKVLQATSTPTSGGSTIAPFVYVDTILGAAPPSTRTGDLATKKPSDMVASGSPTPIVAVAAGCLAAGDSGGGVFYWNPNSTVTDDGGTIINPSASSAPGRWIRIHDKTAYNVKWFGAVGDSVNDDTSAINAAITAAKGGSNIRAVCVLFSAGMYKITSTITYVGAGESLKLTGNLGGTFDGQGAWLMWYGAAGGTMMEVRGVWRPEFENLDFDGRSLAATCFWLRSNQPSGGAGTSGALFRRCTFQNVQTGAMTNTNTWGGTTVTTSVLVKFGDPAGGTYQVDETTFAHCMFRGTWLVESHSTGSPPGAPNRRAIRAASTSTVATSPTVTSASTRSTHRTLSPARGQRSTLSARDRSPIAPRSRPAAIASVVQLS